METIPFEGCHPLVSSLDESAVVVLGAQASPPATFVTEALDGKLFPSKVVTL
jgi:hypothetical protein